MAGPGERGAAGTPGMQRTQRRLSETRRPTPPPRDRGTALGRDLCVERTEDLGTVQGNVWVQGQEGFRAASAKSVLMADKRKLCVCTGRFMWRY